MSLRYLYIQSSIPILPPSYVHRRRLDISIKKEIPKQYRTIKQVVTIKRHQTSNKIQTNSPRLCKTPRHYSTVGKINGLMKSNKLTSNDMTKIDALDNLIIKGVLETDAPLKRIEHSESWYPDLANNIREAFLWKIIKSHKLGKISKDDKINQIISTMKRPVKIERDCIKTIISNLKVAQNQLKQVKQNSANYREDHLLHHTEEYERLGNKKLLRHLRNLITIEQPKEVHQHIIRFIKKTSSNIKYIDIPIETSNTFDKFQNIYLIKTGAVSFNQKKNRYLNKRNSLHLHQAQGTTCTIKSLKEHY